MEEKSIHVHNLTKSFDGRRVVDDLSFSVKKGEVFALLGHNGAGKSTTASGMMAVISTALLTIAAVGFCGYRMHGNPGFPIRF